MTYIQTVAADSPLHWWRLADGGGVMAHDIGSLRVHLAGYDGFGYSCASSDGGSWFAPSNNEVSLPTPLPAVTSPLSVEAWIWLGFTPIANGYILAWDGVAALCVALGELTTGKAFFNVHGVSVAGLTVMAPQRWHHLVATWDNANVRIYVDGTLDRTQAVAGPATFTLPVGIGAGPPNSTGPIDGWISDVAIYNYALTALQIANHYAAADQRTQAPVYTRIAGNTSVSGVNAGQSPAGTQTVLDGLTRAWRNAP